LSGVGAGLTVVVAAPSVADAYVGPGAGFAFVSSFFILFATFFLAFLKVLVWPFRAIVRFVRERSALGKARAQRVVVVGLDGQEPDLTDQFLEEGILPNLAELRDTGAYVRLGTTTPPESPVAWSSFQTGCNPGKHRVFDFLVPNRNTYLPELCSAKVAASAKTLKLGRVRVPLSKPVIDLGRKSQPFWKVLGDHGVFSSVIRVPVTFPPERFRGVLLSAMMVPDLKGSQGTFSYYTTEDVTAGEFTGGQRFQVAFDAAGVMRSTISGPENTMLEGAGDMELPFELRLLSETTNGDGADAEITVQGHTYRLTRDELSEWIHLEFRALAHIKVHGAVRFLLLDTSPELRLYMSPINIDPDKPALPISHPFTYAVYLAKTIGRYATLGLAEDTWGLNERVLDEAAFLKLTYAIHSERERMLFDAIDTTRRGCVACVFDITDRLQHMFFRYLHEDHPANEGKDTTLHRRAIRDLYQSMDEMIGRVRKRLGPNDVLMVMSDHGFKPFRRGVNLNTWLWQNGYLHLKEDEPTGAEWYQDVDWSRTKAWAVGLCGIYLNLKGRNAKGIVSQGEEERALRKEIAEGLEALRDPVTGSAPVKKVYDTHEAYSGPYVREGPELVVGYTVGYRASWHCATGIIDTEVLEDNGRSWSGDHCMNPPDVPGILFTNRPLSTDQVSIMDIGPTILDLFGVPVPRHCDGRSVMPEGSA
jgi:predicted AlkP superfamily phosphohydrolase/phosphomutase